MNVSRSTALLTLACRMIHGDYAASGGIGLTWLEVCQRQAKVIPEVGPVYPVRIIIGMSLVCKLQIVWPVICTVHLHAQLFLYYIYCMYHTMYGHTCIVRVS